MKKSIIAPIFIFLSILATACNSNSQKAGDTEHPADSIAITQTNEAPVAPNAEASKFSAIKASVGKYPADVNLMKDAVLAERLKSLLGDKYENMMKYWNTETPIVEEADVISTSGCEAHNCIGNHYLLYIDHKNDNINVYHFQNGKVATYFEKGEIALPTNMKKEFDATKGN